MPEIQAIKDTIFQVGYALNPKNMVTFTQPSFVKLAKARGIELVKIDVAKPLVEQGLFDCIIQKLYGEDWKKQLEDYSSKNANLIMIDRPDAIEKLHNRVTMLEAVTKLCIPSHYPKTCTVPNQVLVEDKAALLDRIELKFPVIAKPVLANGGANSHNMSLVYNSDGLKELEMEGPIVLQEFVNHGGVIFKVYVAGCHVRCVKRRSLPDILELDPHSQSILSFCQISNLTDASNTDSIRRGMDKIDVIDSVEMPEWGFVEEVAKGLREGLGLQLFNFDLIRESMDGNRFYVIDINYFPGYATLPSYETMLTDFFNDVAAGRRQVKVDNAATLELESSKNELNGSCGKV